VFDHPDGSEQHGRACSRRKQPIHDVSGTVDIGPGFHDEPGPGDVEQVLDQLTGIRLAVSQESEEPALYFSGDPAVGALSDAFNATGGPTRLRTRR
jgi:hypothetical protein